jgi:hypothetical protein
MKYFETKYVMTTFITFDNSLGDYVWNEVYMCIYSFMVATFYAFLYFRISLMFIYSPYISHCTKYLDSRVFYVEYYLRLSIA